MCLKCKWSFNSFVSRKLIFLDAVHNCVKVCIYFFRCIQYWSKMNKWWQPVWMPCEGYLFLWLHVYSLGDDLKMTVTVDPRGKPAPIIRFYRGTRELKDDSRVTIRTDGFSSSFSIKRTRQTDEAKYTVNIESEGAITDSATFSVFIKGDWHDNCVFRAANYPHFPWLVLSFYIPWTVRNE